MSTTGNSTMASSKLDLNCDRHFIDAQHVLLHLQNSGEVPLDVTITIPDVFPYSDYSAAIYQLRQAVRRIKSLTINAPFSDAWQKVVSDIGEGQPAPLLVRLVLTVKYDSDVSSLESSFTVLSTSLAPSPNLVHLQIPAWPLPEHPPPQLSSITSLAFDTPFSNLVITDLTLRALASL